MQMAASSLLPSMGLLHRMPTQAGQTKPRRQTVKKVSWAPEDNLCQIRLFLAEDAPVQSGQGVQDQLQAKRPWLWHAVESGFDYDLPPGFDRGDEVQYVQEEASIVPQTTWRCPPRFVINPEWQVVAGDESHEIKVQCEREVRIFEAVYPRPSAIPPSPAEPLEPQEEYDDSKTPQIPLTPIEEEDAGDFDDEVASFSLHENFQGGNSRGLQQLTDSNSGQWLKSTGMLPFSDNSVTTRTDQQPTYALTSPTPAIEPDIAAAAAAAFLAIMRSNEEGSMIDQDLLIKILSNPQIMETLIVQHRKINNTLTENNPSPLPNNKELNGNESTHQVAQEASPPAVCKPNDAFQVAPTVIVGSNKSRASTGESPFSCIQGYSHPSNTETKATRPIEGLDLINARLTKMPMASSAPVPSGGKANPQAVLRPATVPPTSTAHAICQTPKGVPTTVQTISTKRSGSQNEQYYKNLIQQHGGPNKNDNVHQTGIQYRKDLIQHGGQQKVERGPQLQYGNNDRFSSLDANKSKFRKPCMYFNTPKGCRRGASCTFLHEHVDRPRIDETDMQHAKRAKVEIEVSGRN
eukprot:Gb_26085 [translate_table: standard]